MATSPALCSGRPQLGLITVAQAADRRVDRFALARRRQTGSLVTVFADVMRLGAVAPSPSQTMLAGSLAVPGSIVAAVSASVVHQMRVPAGIWMEKPPTVVVEPHRSARTPGITTVVYAHPLPTRQ